MARTMLPGRQVTDGSIQRADLDTTTAGSAIIARVIAGTNISLSSTGADAGTGDVTVSFGGVLPVASGGTGRTTAATARTALGAQAELGYTPIQQGTGTSQTSNAVKIGWSVAGWLRCQVDATDFGANWPINAATATLASAASGLAALDTRSSVTTPHPGGSGMTLDLKYNATEGLSDGGSYFGSLSLRQWTEPSGGLAHQIGLTDNANLWHRHGAGAAWGAWKKVVDSANVGSYAPGLTGAGASGTWGISISGTATVANQVWDSANGRGMLFYWSGQSNQPTWLWGSNDGILHYVWNPSNFSVANSEKLANTTPSAFGLSLIEDANASAARTTLELGSAATLNAGTGANQVVQRDASGSIPGAVPFKRTVTTVSGSISVPSWATKIEIYAVGGGGSGDNQTSGTTGKPGTCVYASYTVTAGSVSTLTATVGSSGDTNTNWNNGVAGGTTTVTGTGISVSAAGGSGNGGPFSVTTSNRIPFPSGFVLPGYGTAGIGNGSNNSSGAYNSTGGAVVVEFSA